MNEPQKNGPDPGGSETPDQAAKIGPLAVIEESVLPLGGAGSWDELDTYRESQKLEDHVRVTTHEFQMLIRNIFRRAAIGEIENVGAAMPADRLSGSGGLAAPRSYSDRPGPGACPDSPGLARSQPGRPAGRPRPGEPRGYPPGEPPKGASVQ